MKIKGLRFDPKLRYLVMESKNTYRGFFELPDFDEKYGVWVHAQECFGSVISGLHIEGCESNALYEVTHTQNGATLSQVIGI